MYSQETNAETWIDNLVQEGKTENSNTKFKSVKFELLKNEMGFYTPKFKIKGGHYKGQNLLNIFNIPGLDDDYKIQKDMMKQDRVNEVVGSYLPGKMRILSPYANEDNTGPKYLRNN